MVVLGVFKEPFFLLSLRFEPFLIQHLRQIDLLLKLLTVLLISNVRLKLLDLIFSVAFIDLVVLDH